MWIFQKKLVFTFYVLFDKLFSYGGRKQNQKEEKGRTRIIVAIFGRPTHTNMYADIELWEMTGACVFSNYGFTNYIRLQVDPAFVVIHPQTRDFSCKFRAGRRRKSLVLSSHYIKHQNISFLSCPRNN